MRGEGGRGWEELHARAVHIALGPRQHWPIQPSILCESILKSLPLYRLPTSLCMPYLPLPRLHLLACSICLYCSPPLTFTSLSHPSPTPLRPTPHPHLSVPFLTLTSPPHPSPSPLCPTPHPHLSAPPLTLTSLSHPSPSPLCPTPHPHLSAPPLTLTSLSHPSPSPLCPTPHPHLSAPPLTRTSLPHPSPSPLCPTPHPHLSAPPLTRTSLPHPSPSPLCPTPHPHLSAPPLTRTSLPHPSPLTNSHYHVTCTNMPPQSSDIVFAAGQIGLHPGSMTLAGETEQPTLSLTHVQRVLGACHAHLGSALCGTCYFTTEEAWWAATQAWAKVRGHRSELPHSLP